MICEPLKQTETGRFSCEPQEATHLRLKIGNRLESQLPVQLKGSRAGTENWSWNGNVEKPTLKPSIRAEYYDWKEKGMRVCHVWLNDGIVQHLSDCTCGKAGTKEPLKELDE